MRILFDSNLTGASKDFIWEDGSLHFSDLSNPDWHFDTRKKRAGCVRAASEAAGLNLVLEPGSPQVKFWKKHTQFPAWHRILTRDKFEDHIRNQIRVVTDFLSDENNKYFLTTFQVQQSLIDALQPARVSDKSLQEFGFLPDRDGFVSIPEYDNVSSSTGRMSIKSGPKILTMQRDLRKNIVSRWSDGVLVEVDFRALEARVLCWICGNKPDTDDVYEWISKKMETGNVPREVVKEATLAAIYGMSRRNFVLRYQDMPDSPEIYDSIRKLMRVKDLEDKLTKLDRFENAFGRPLRDANARVSHHVQSSAVDIACHGFHDLLKRINGDHAVPIFLIHDAIVLDVRKSYVPEVEKICKEGLMIDIIGHRFPVKAGRFIK